MTNFTINSSRFQLLVAPIMPILERAIITHRSDWLCRKFSARTHFLLSLFAQFVHAPTANALLEALNHVTLSPQKEPNLRHLLDFDWLDPLTQQPVTLNQSSFSRANNERSFRLWRWCFHQLWPVAARQCALAQLEGLGQIVAVDGSLLDCLPPMAWAAYRTSSPKLKGHFFFNANGLPEKLVLTTGKGSEREVLRQHLRPGVTYVLDRGYNAYALFNHLATHHAHFVTRLLANASIETLSEQTVEVAQAQLGLHSDRTFRFNNDPAGRLYRLVEYQPPQAEMRCYITSRTDLTPLEVVKLYEWRWQIELFFKWIKSHLQLRHGYSEDENGILIQLYADLVAFLLLKLFAQWCNDAEMRRMNIKMVRWVQRHLFDLVTREQLEHYLNSIGLHPSDDTS